MKNIFKASRFILIFISIIFVISSTLSLCAHSGRTDSRGGHKDTNNVSGLGYYHYHCGGHPPHLHENGICPYKNYESDKKTSSKISSSSSKINSSNISNIPNSTNSRSNSKPQYVHHHLKNPSFIDTFLDFLSEDPIHPVILVIIISILFFLCYSKIKKSIKNRRDRLFKESLDSHFSKEIENILRFFGNKYTLNKFYFELKEYLPEDEIDILIKKDAEIFKNNLHKSLLPLFETFMKESYDAIMNSIDSDNPFDLNYEKLREVSLNYEENQKSIVSAEIRKEFLRRKNQFEEIIKKK